MNFSSLSGLLLFLLCLNLAVENPAYGQSAGAKPIYVSGEGGYACFRIPAVLTTKSGSLLAFAEGRKGGCSDTGDIDLLLKRSEDGGKSWSGLEVVWDDGQHTCGNPAPVLDEESGDIVLLTTWNRGEDKESEIIAQTSTDTRRVFVLRSTDEGQSWSKPKEITTDVKKENWTWYATGPGSGIQLTEGAYVGRLMVACDHIEAKTKKYYSHVIYSDDGGKSWQLGGNTPRDQVNECEVVQLNDGRLMLNMRNYDRDQHARQLAYSEDGGMQWENMRHAPELIEPICQGAMLRYDTAGETYILFSNPASKEQRVNMTLKMSKDEGKTWMELRQLFAGPSAYSDLARVGAHHVGILYERGEERAYEGIFWDTIDMKEVLPSGSD
ncbi:sialidase-1 [Catalinimonas alkaloidigena]|uniref:sialidase family protein n=1 Tax=Catalinimonas alkaloidigena TaxID=1075417 RepID=UPI0024071CE1|nr:sialidase family protein [Catalinimonas alkaloidigena]MDF9800458.1 sialidase-1 [Catalinimonas alkaloidigena]